MALSYEQDCIAYMEEQERIALTYKQYVSAILEKYDQLISCKTPTIVRDKCFIPYGYSYLTNSMYSPILFEDLFPNTGCYQGPCSPFDIKICQDGTIDVEHLDYQRGCGLKRFAVFPASITNEDYTVNHAVLICIDRMDPDNLTWSLLDCNGNGWYDDRDTQSIAHALSNNPKMQDYLMRECQKINVGCSNPWLKHVLPINIHSDPTAEKRGCCVAWMTLMAILLVHRCFDDSSQNPIDHMLLSLQQLGNEKRTELMRFIIAEFPD